MITSIDHEGIRTILITHAEVMGKLMSMKQDISDIQLGIAQQWQTMDQSQIRLGGAMGAALRDLDTAMFNIQSTLEALRGGGYAAGQDL